MATEFECKFSASPAQQEQIHFALGTVTQTLQMETTYYDTPDKALSRRFWTLRRRMENGTPVCTLKTPAGGLGRNEFECRCDTVEAAIPQLCALMGSRALLALTVDGVQPICGARFTRKTFWITRQDFEAEVALDRGILFGGSREQPLCEVEVELKGGSRDSMLDYARDLQEKFDLRIEHKSKFRRALELAEGEK